MGNNKQYTKRQHVIPATYLKGFSFQYEGMKNIKEGFAGRDYKLFYYDFEKEMEFGPVTANSICVENDFYEVTGNNGEVVLENFLENCFGILEKQFAGKVLELETKLENRSSNQEEVLSQESFTFFAVFMVLQFLRLPQTIQAAETLFGEFFPNMTKKQIMNNGRVACLPFFGQLTEDSTEGIILTNIIESLSGMNVYIGLDKEGRLVASDKPMYVIKERMDGGLAQLVIYPITRKLCLVMERNGRNCVDQVIDLSKEQIEFLKKCMVRNSFRRFFYSNKLDDYEKEELVRIKRVRDS